MKGVFVILDGIADQPCYALGQKTPLEAAKTPNLDAIAEKSKLDYCYTVKKDYVPESNEGVLSLFGYDSFAISRGQLEALGIGVNLKTGDLALRCNFATIDSLDNGAVLDRRAGRTLTTKEAKILAKAVNDNVKLRFKFKFYSSIQHRGVLVINGGFSDNISNVEVKGDKLNFSKPLDDIDDSKLSSDLVNEFTRKSFEVLDKHPVNIARARKGLFAANVLLCRGAGSEKLKLKKLKGAWIGLGYMPLEIGIEKAVGMDIYKFKYPKFKGFDVYDNLYLGLRKAIKNAKKMLKRYRKTYDYFYIHIKECDIPGHDNKPLDKVKMIEILDDKLFGFLREFIGEGRLVVTGDHATVCRLKGHSSDAVPVLSYSNLAGKTTKGQRFVEVDGLKGKRIFGRKLLEERFFRK